jgi:hypothetical protein
LGHEKAQKGPGLNSVAGVASIDAAGIRPADKADQSVMEGSSACEKHLRGDYPPFANRQWNEISRSGAKAQ